MAHRPGTVSEVKSDGLRYAKKTSGSAFSSNTYNTQATMSCFRCGRHRPRDMMVFKRLFGRSHLVCEPNCESVAERLSAG